MNSFCSDVSDNDSDPGRPELMEVEIKLKYENLPEKLKKMDEDETLNTQLHIEVFSHT
jgi:hypothetical protein